MNKTAVADASAATNEGPETSGGQPARASNIDAIVAYFESGITPAGTAGELGIELEHTLVHDDMSPVAYSGPYGVESVSYTHLFGHMDGVPAQVAVSRRPFRQETRRQTLALPCLRCHYVLSHARSHDRMLRPSVHVTAAPTAART